MFYWTNFLEYISSKENKFLKDEEMTSLMEVGKISYTSDILFFYCILPTHERSQALDVTSLYVAWNVI